MYDSNIYITHNNIFTSFIDKDMFLRGVFYAAEKYESLYKKKSIIPYAKKYHEMIMKNKPYIESEIQKVRINIDSYSSRKPTLVFASDLIWESQKFQNIIRANSHLLSLQYYYSYNIFKHNDDLYFLKLADRFKHFTIKV